MAAAEGDKPCEHAYHVALGAGVATGQPCARCGEPFDPKAGRR